MVNDIILNVQETHGDFAIIGLGGGMYAVRNLVTGTMTSSRRLDIHAARRIIKALGRSFQGLYWT